MKRVLVVLVLSLEIVVSARGVAQSIGPDGRVLPAISGHVTTPPISTPPAVNTPAAPPPPTLVTPPTTPVVNAPVAASTAKAPNCPTVIGAYYLQSNDWVSMDPSHSIGFKTTNVAGAAFSYGAPKAKVKAQFRDPHSPYQLRSNAFAMCLVGITDSGRDIAVAKFQEEKDRREISMASYRLWTGINAQIDSKVIIQVSVEKKGDKVYLVTSKELLPQGEFILFTIIPDMAAMTKANTPSSLGGYDSGHHEHREASTG
jgi:hypothetical protein